MHIRERQAGWTVISEGVWCTADNTESKLRVTNLLVTMQFKYTQANIH